MAWSVQNGLDVTQNSRNINIILNVYNVVEKSRFTYLLNSYKSVFYVFQDDIPDDFEEIVKYV